MTSARDLLPGVPLVHSPFFDEVAETSNWDAESRRVATALNRDGFALIDFPEPDLDALVKDIASTVFAPLTWEPWRSGQTDMMERVSDAWRDNASVRAIAVNAQVIDLLSRVYGRQAFPFQTLNFPIGSQQNIHVDVVHFHSAPENFMCGVWLALEDIEPGAGPLRYYPGSHRWPLILNEHVGRKTPTADMFEDYDKLEAAWAKMYETYGATPVEFYPKKGQAMIWVAGLHHGGAPHTDRTKTRHSQVTHYMFRDCAYWTPLASNPLAGQIAFRETFPDIRTGQTVPNSVNGAATPSAFMNIARPQIWGGPTPAPAPRPTLARRALGRLRRMIAG